MKIINISVSGLNVLHDKNTPIEIGKWIDGKILFLNDKSLEITGQFIWEGGNEAGMLLSGRIAYPIIEEQMSIYMTESP